MKKMLKVIMPCILICLFLSACQKSYINAPATDRLEISTQSDVSSDSEEKALTKEQVIQIFMNEKDNSNCVITDCVVAEDMASVSYTHLDVYKRQVDGCSGCICFLV